MPAYDNYPNYRSGKYIDIYSDLLLYIPNDFYIFFSFASCPTEKLIRIQRQIDKVRYCFNFIYSHNP